MQLKNKFAQAATSLLGATLSVTAVAEPAEWKTTIGAIYYSEGDDRVDDKAIQVKATRTTEDEKTLNLTLGIDTLTGASPSGRVPANGKGGLRLTNLSDTRTSGGISYSQRLSESLIGNVGVTTSSENDYDHLGVNFGITKEFNQKNSTISLGFAKSSDTILGVGGNRVPGVSTTTLPNYGEQDKDVNDIVLGFSQVLSKKTIAQFNYSRSNSSGYLNDPYKVVSRIRDDGVPTEFLVENRPNERLGQSLYAAVNTKTDWGVFKPSFRYYTDDWGVDSQTLELRFVKELSGNREIEPYFRFYHQSSADFYRAQIPNTESVPTYFSSDYRLSAFNAYTLGAIYRWKGSSGLSYSAGMDYYWQDPSTPADQLAGQSDLNPGINAFMFRFTVTF